MSDWIDVPSAAEHLGVPVSFVRRLVLERRIRYYKMGKYVRFRLEDLDGFVEEGLKEPVPEIPRAWTYRRSSRPDRARSRGA
jgi:excisionase family DNA binding protein